MKKYIENLMKGAYDIHIHSSPDIIPRKLHDIELAKKAKSAGLSGILLKNHFTETASRASLVKQVVKNLEVYGGIVLNKSVGGLNPNAVEVALKLGAKEVWMPTVDSENHRRKNGLKDGISIRNENTALVIEILKLISSYNAILGTGHLSIEEIIVLVDLAKKYKVEKILITHPEFWIVNIPISTQQELAKKGVFFERCYNSTTLQDKNKTPFTVLTEQIKEVGINSTILSTDLGQVHNPEPIEGMKIMIETLIESGIRENYIEKMIKDNPYNLLH